MSISKQDCTSQLLCFSSLKTHNIDYLALFRLRRGVIKMGKPRIEFEDVTIRVPKAIMDFLRSMEKACGTNASETIVHDLIALIQAEIENMTGKDLIELWNLAPVFNNLRKPRP